MRDLTGGQVQEVLDRLLYSALQPIVLHSKLFDSTLVAILSLTTVNRKRKIATASRNKEDNRKKVIDRCCRVWVVDVEERFEVIRSLGIERNIISVFVTNFLKHKEAFMGLYEAEDSLDCRERLQAICTHLRFTDIESLYVAFVRAEYFIKLYTKYVGLLVDEYAKLCHSIASEAASSNPNIDKADLHQKLLFGVYTGINKYNSNNGALTAYLKWWLLNAKNSYGDYEYGVAYVIPQAKRKELTESSQRAETNYSVSLDDSVNEDGVSRYDTISDSTNLVDEQTYESVNAIIARIAKRVDGEDGIGRLVMPIPEYYSPITYKRMLRHMRAQGKMRSERLLKSELRRLKVSGFDTITPNTGGRDSARLEEVVEVHSLTPKTWEDLRFLPQPILPIKRHWVNIIKNDGKTTALPKLCLAHDPSKPDNKSGIECPYCALEHGKKEDGASASMEFFYLAQAIVRDIQEDKPSRANKQKLTSSEKKTGHKDIASKSWTPIRPIRLTNGSASKLKALKERNKVKGKSFAVDNGKYGMDVAIMFDPDQAGAAKYSIDRGERSPLNKEEQSYLTWDLGSQLLEKIGLETLEEAEAWIQRSKIVGGTNTDSGKKKKKRGRRDEDVQLGSKKKRSRSRLGEDEDEKPRRKKKRPSRDDEDEKPRRKKKRPSRDEDEPRSKKKKRSSSDDKPRRRKSSSDEAPRRKKKRRA